MKGHRRRRSGFAAILRRGAGSGYGGEPEGRGSHGEEGDKGGERIRVEGFTTYGSPDFHLDERV